MIFILSGAAFLVLSAWAAIGRRWDVAIGSAIVGLCVALVGYQ